jgi:Concanavalin A-like lectin/glucanases superfamily
MGLLEDAENPYLTFKEQAAPSAAAAGDQRVYIDSADHSVKRIDASGTVVTIAGGGSAADVTYDPSGSGLAATNAQAGIDELAHYLTGGGTPGAFAAAILAMSGLVGFWRLNDGFVSVRAMDSGPNGLHGNLIGATVGRGAIYSGDASAGSALFSGMGYIEVPDTAALHLGDVVTVMAIIRPFSVAGPHAIASKGSGAYYLRTNSTNISFVRSAVSEIVTSTGVALAAGTSYLASSTKTGGTVKLYVNGTDRTGSVSNSTLVDNSSPLQIGIDRNTNEGFVGQMSEVALFSRALSSTEESDLFALAGL